MDAARLTFPDQSFDVVYAAYVMSVVPDPLAVLSEMRRVCRVGGHIVLLNHFLSDIPFLAKVERLFSPIATARLGFRTDHVLDFCSSAPGYGASRFARSTRRKSVPSLSAGGMIDERASRNSHARNPLVAFVGERVSPVVPPRLARCWWSHWETRAKSGHISFAQERIRSCDEVTGPADPAMSSGITWSRSRTLRYFATVFCSSRARSGASAPSA